MRFCGLNAYLMYSGNEIHMYAPSDLEPFFPNLLCFGNEHKDCLFCEFDSENDNLFLW